MSCSSPKAFCLMTMITHEGNFEFGTLPEPTTAFQLNSAPMVVMSHFETVVQDRNPFLPQSSSKTTGPSITEIMQSAVKSSCQRPPREYSPLRYQMHLITGKYWNTQQTSHSPPTLISCLSPSQQRPHSYQSQIPSQKPEHRHRPPSQNPVPPPQLASALGSRPCSSLGSCRVPGVGSAAARRDRLAMRRSFIVWRGCERVGGG